MKNGKAYAALTTKRKSNDLPTIRIRPHPARLAITGSPSLGRDRGLRFTPGMWPHTDHPGSRACLARAAQIEEEMKLSSECCGAQPWEYCEPYQEPDGTYTGMCNACKEHCLFLEDDPPDRRDFTLTQQAVIEARIAESQESEP